MNLLIDTPFGRVQGGYAKSARHWLGVPYARAERFGLPLDPAPWTGTRNATSFGPECPQLFGSLRTRKLGRGVSEDCLVLNIWAPHSDDAELKPVMVWIHGGAFMAGSGNMYDGAELAARGNIVVVTINYRLGVLGFANLREALDLPELPSNLGLRDQIAALQWVHANIAAFGGDPQRVTIAGESAGSISAAALMLCPSTWPLYHGAILQSGAISLLHNHERSLRIGGHYRDVLNLKANDLDQLRRMNLETLLRAQSRVQAREHCTVPAAPWFDGDLLPASLAEARKSATANVPLLAGFNRDEIRAFEWMKGPAFLPMTRAANELLIRQQLPELDADRILATYADVQADNRALATHLTFGIPTLNFAERHAQRNPTWFYRFDYSHALLGAAHGLDLAFLWNFKGLLGFAMRGGFATGARRTLVERMQRHWIHFVRNGCPESDWPRYTLERRSVLLLDREVRMADDPQDIRRDAWAGADVHTNVTP